MSDEKYYLQVEQELKESERDEALWSKSMALARDDETEAKAKYIQLRVDQLKKKELQTKAKDLVDPDNIGTLIVILIVALAILLLMGVAS